jgi:thiamine biosynthesis protein ThiS
MKKIKKIKININGKSKFINDNLKLLNLIKILKIPVKKVAIELNHEIVDKKKMDRIFLKKNDKIEIVHFIGGG